VTAACFASFTYPDIFRIRLFLGKRGGQQCVLPDAQSCAIWPVLKNFKKSKETG